MKLLAILAVLLIAPTVTSAEVWQFKKPFLELIVKRVPDILKSQDKTTGRFGTGIWIVNDQHAMYPLAVAWATNMDGVDNPHYHNPNVLEAIMSAGDALIADQKPDGRWEFRKKDGSTWGDIYMPWTYSRWVRSFSLIRDAMPADRRAKWEKALTLGMEGVSKSQLGKRIQNIPAHNAMGLYLASKLFDREDWRDGAVDYLHRTADEETADGWWTEHCGPVVIYNSVYVDLLGCYYGMSRDPRILPHLAASARFTSAMTYPDGRAIETVDERNPYHHNILAPNVGFTFTPEGRRYVKRQIELLSEHTDKPVPPDTAASFILYGEEGELAPQTQAGQLYLSGDKQVMTRRDTPWFFCLTSYTAEVPQNRWIQDRQNFLSLYRDGMHVILGGGNTKLQPLWSTFTVGDTALLYHKKGDEDPKFLPPKGIIHTPTSASLDPSRNSLDLLYGDVKCNVTIDTSDNKAAKIVYSLLSPANERVEAHVPLLVEFKGKWTSGSGKSGTFAEGDVIKLTPGEAGEWLAHNGWRISVPPQASLHYPALPHNPYTKDGRAEPHEGRLVMTLPFENGLTRYEIILEVDEKKDAREREQ